METVRIQNGQTERIWVTLIDDSGAAVTGGTVNLSIKRLDNGQWWNGSAFQAGYTTVSMTELDATNWPGDYYYDFTSNVNNIKTRSRVTYSSKVYTGLIYIGDFVQNLDETVSSTKAEALAAKLQATLARKIVINKVTISGTTFTIYDDDETTPIYTGTVTDVLRDPA